MDDIEIAPSSYNETQNGPKSEEQEKESVENFQKFFYELFEKNGILNDLRAYLRRHIVEVLKKNNTGDTPMCQKHFSQRLELKAQAINILVAEYLLHSELNYTLSVFVSEIPLANMMFDYASSLMNGNGDCDLYFKDKDVLSIINYLGIKCDSRVVSNIVQTYKTEKQPLLLCIMKNMTMIPAEIPYVEPVTSSEEGLSELSSDVSEKTSKKFSKFSNKCQHYTLCRSCHYKLLRLKEKYKKKKEMTKVKESSQMSMNLNSLMKNISNIEGSLVNEMFEQLKSVYETELDMMRSKQERRVQQALQQHAHALQMQRQEMEDTFRARSEELERGVRAKKKFLWGLARSLRAQHDYLARAMLAVKYHTQRLRVKEENLKAQLLEVEHLMETRGEDMQVQISAELLALKTQLESVKMEREAVNKEKSELEHLRREINIHHANIDIDEIAAISDNAWSNYDLLKNELNTIRKYDPSLDSKCMLDHGTITEETQQHSAKSAEILNNEQKQVVREEDKRLNTNQLVNDLKKQKNVNFSMGNVEEMCAERHCPAQDPPQADNDALTQLVQENARLKEYAKQQEQQVAQLRSCAQQLQSRSPRPHTAPPADTSTNETPSTPTTNQLGWRCKGAGEDTNLLKCALPQVFVPGDTVPFIGLLHDRHAEPKRLMNQWRCARRASPLRARRAPSPAAGAAAPAPAPAPSPPQSSHGNTYSEISALNQNESDAHSNQQPDVLIPDLNSPAGTSPPASRSPRAAPRRARPNKKHFLTLPPSTSNSTREESPTTVLREAKLRLRKLEIEAEAVEKSYMDYRKRQNEMKSERELNAPVKEEAVVTKDVGGLSKQAYKIGNENTDETQKPFKTEFHAFLQEHRRKFNLNETHFANKNTTANKVKPIPEAFSTKNTGKADSDTTDYIEPSLAEFRKLYKSSSSFTKAKNIDVDQELNKNKHKTNQRPFMPPTPATSNEPTTTNPPAIADPSIGDSLETEVQQLEAKKDALIKAKNTKKVELEILKLNVSKMYDNYYDDDKAKDEDVVSQDVDDGAPSPPGPVETASLRIEVEKLSQSNEMTVSAEPKHVLLVVKNNINNKTSPTTEVEEKHFRGDMTILMSPKRSDNQTTQKQKSPRSMSPEQAAKLTRNDVLEAIFQADTGKVNSNEDLGEVASKGNLSEGGNDGDDYQDDFSADVDNYDYSRTDCTHSPPSLPAHSASYNWDDA